MSDGPHVSLNMPYNWKRYAKLAYNPACSIGEVLQGLEEALNRDFQNEVSGPIFEKISSINDNYGTQLFDCVRIDELDKIQNKTRGKALARLVVNCMKEVVMLGQRGNDALVNAIENALQERAVRGARQVIEHYQRLYPERNRGRISNRVNQTVKTLNYRRIAQLFAQGNKLVGNRSIKKIGLDDGVEL